MANDIQLQLFDIPPRMWRPDEIFSVQDPYDLRKVSESSSFERKTYGIHARQLSKWISAYSIVKPDGGVIGIGIRDDGSLEGCMKADQPHINRLEQVRDYCPDARIEIRRVDFFHHDGKPDFILLFRVKFRHDKLVRTTDGHAYRREGDSTKEIGDEESREIESQIGQSPFEREPCMLVWPDDFDMAAVEWWAIRARRSNVWSEGTTVEQVLSNLNLGTYRQKAGFVPNMACALLFANNPTQIIPGCRIHLLKFRGEVEGTGEQYSPMKDQFIQGTIPQLIVKAEQWIDAQLRDFTRLGQDGKFFTGPEYPKLAWYEAIVNACVHRSYNLRRMNITVKLFEDHLVVESPGGFPPFVSPENIYEMPSHPTNPHLFHAMWYLERVRCNSEGTKRIRDQMAQINLPPPEFREHQQDFVSVRVTLRNDVVHRKVWVDGDAAALLGKAAFDELDDDERRIVNFLAEYERVNVSQAQLLTQLTWPRSKRLLVGMVEKRILKHMHKPGDDRDPQAYFVLRSK